MVSTRPFVAQVVEAVGPWLKQVVQQVTVGDDTERANGRQIATVLAVQVVGLFVIPDNFSLETPRQIETVQENIARVVGIAIA